ncbi:MAG: hypothetical protein B7X39_13485 [Lysobacterales bacterium 14-68-21]|jgi:uncharacterized protein YqiB (DUF1249 family)|nr:MAG: hypothetical protein B7X45_12375 [Xanthomonadales bacterium 15-68-25]OZB65278.1 MAG: hypothetical protein B7X39_13485 [Xanthomonadales bacterium 14-68-21]
MSVVLDRRTALLPGRFEFLMGLYAENYHRLARLFAPQELVPGRYVSSIDDGLDVHLQVLERHPYTLELELTYDLIDEQTGLRTPSAQLRVYTDAHVAEALHCHPGRHLWQVLGPFPPARTVLQHRLRMNGFLTRWLEYLAEQGHSLGTLAREPEPPAPVP